MIIETNLQADTYFWVKGMRIAIKASLYGSRPGLIVFNIIKTTDTITVATKLPISETITIPAQVHHNSILLISKTITIPPQVHNNSKHFTLPIKILSSHIIYT